MAITEPDVGLLTSSAQIFSSNHTLPQIRAIHKTLHVQVDDKATRLRTQVGGSYRELLGTAETIVQMRTDMEGAQTTLAGMGGRCGRAVVGGKVTALASFVDHEQEQSSLSLAARAKLLEACSRTVGRLLSRTNPDYSANATTKTSSKISVRQQRQQQRQQQQQQSWGERLMLASKVLVLSRLLLSGMNDKSGDAPSLSKTRSKQSALQDAAVLSSIEASKRTLASLRRRLRDMIEVVERSVPTTASEKAAADVEEAGDDDNDDLDGANEDGEDDEDAREQRDRNRVLSATATARDDLLRALCAHSLATTSGARDVLWQLLHVRSQAMALAFEMDDEEHQNHHQADQGQQPLDCRASWKADNVLRGLALYTKTLLDVQALLPHRLPEALLGLKRRALLDDDALRQIEGLRLDVYSRWCGEDVQYFKPYIRHDDLDAAQAREMLTKWAERGSEVFVSGLKRALEQADTSSLSSSSSADKPAQGHPSVIRRYLDMHAIVNLRTRVLQLWIRDSSKARGFDPSELLDKMRAVFNQQMLQVLATKVGKLRLVGSEVAATLASWQDGVSDRHAQLWGNSNTDVNHKDIDTDLSEGAVSFVRDVVTRLHGRSDAVAKAVASYTTWRHVVNDVAAVVDQLRKQRWDNDVDDIVEDEDTIAQRQQLLSKDDPQTLHDRLEAALNTAFQDLNTQITAEWASVAKSDTLSATTKGNIAMYLVRVLREIRSRRPATSSSAVMSQLGLEIIPELHAAIVRVVVVSPLEQFTSKTLTRKTVAGRILWDVAGTSAALPLTPSPGVFRFVRDLSTAMDTAGMDLWSPAAVAELKQQVAEQLGEQWIKLLETADYLQETAEKTNGKEDGDNGEKEDEASASTALAEDDRKDLLKQWLFDIAWLRCSLGGDSTSSTSSNKDKKDKSEKKGIVELENAVFKRTGLSEAKEANSSGGRTPQQRITKAAQDYWKKTSLLFGLLA